MKKNRIIVPILFLFVASGPHHGHGQTSKTPTALTTVEAASHIGEVATVSGIVVDTRYLSSSRGRPTFLNLDKPYPNRIFRVVIWGADRDKFGEPEKKYRDKNICVTGLIRRHHGRPEIIAKDPKQIRIMER
ncbi:MAG: DNA-binding protein [Candidatus Aminicenantales bacterium]|jgi:micrococcal nuclease